MNWLRKLVACVVFMALVLHADAQGADTAVARKILLAKDTIVEPLQENVALKETDSTKLKNPNHRSPGKAALKSAILPGWGQVYNKKIWKVPIVYAALGGTAWYFFDNLVWYKDFRRGYKVAYNIATNGDSTGYDKIKFSQVRRAVDNNQQNQLKYYRDDFRKNIDYSAVYFALAWALNVVDAAVDAHLSSFDVSPDLGFKIQPGYSEMAQTKGLSLVLVFK